MVPGIQTSILDDVSVKIQISNFKNRCNILSCLLENETWFTAEVLKPPISDSVACFHIVAHCGWKCMVEWWSLRQEGIIRKYKIIFFKINYTSIINLVKS